MLKLNKFFWQLYKNSSSGANTISNFEKLALENSTIEDLIVVHKKFNPEDYLNTDEVSTKQYFQTVLSYIPSKIRVFLQFDIEDIYFKADEIISNMSNDECKELIIGIVPISVYLYKLRPDYFVPYLFHMRYKYLQQIVEDYELEVPEIPGKANMQKRLKYYFNLCEELYKFRILNGLSGAELGAFIYDMERQSYDSNNQVEATPYPKVWMIGGSKDTIEEAHDKILFWQANPETKKGDIMIFYETGKTWYEENKSSITGIWTALSDGTSDPLFYYYGHTVIGNEVKIKPIHINVLRNDPRTTKLPRLGASFCGIRGDAVSVTVYEGLLELIEEFEASFDRTKLPQLHEPYRASVRFEDRGDMKPEKWVEEFLVKEMLEQMGWNRPEIDYRRQVHLQMGRKKVEDEKIQDGKTDFSLFPFGNRLKCADVLIEVKAPGEMNGKDIEKAFWQAESYASRQYSSLIILADGDKILLFPRKKEIFSYSNTPESFTWNEIFSNKEKFNKLRDIILKHKKHNRK